MIPVDRPGLSITIASTILPTMPVCFGKILSLTVQIGLQVFFDWELI
jgi:hypothetical protein